MHIWCRVQIMDEMPHGEREMYNGEPPPHYTRFSYRRNAIFF